MFLSDFVKTPVVHTLHGNFYKGEINETKREVLKRFKKPGGATGGAEMAILVKRGLPEILDRLIRSLYPGVSIRENRLKSPVPAKSKNGVTAIIWGSFHA